MYLFFILQQYIYNNLRLALQNGRTSPQLMASFSPLVMQTISQLGLSQPPFVISMQLQQQQAQIANLPPLAQQIISQCLNVQHYTVNFLFCVLYKARILGV